MGCGSENIILGLLWLKKINPRIDWVTETVTIPRKSDQTFIKIIRGEGNLIPQFKKRGKEFTPSIRKTTIATELAKANTQTETTLPEKYKEYASVFSEEEAH